MLAGKAKANLLGEKIFFSGCLAGAFIGYGAYLACTVGGTALPDHFGLCKYQEAS